MTENEMKIVEALKKRPMREGELKQATGLKSLWSDLHHLGRCKLVRCVMYAEWPDDDNKLYWLSTD